MRMLASMLWKNIGMLYIIILTQITPHGVIFLLPLLVVTCMANIRENKRLSIVPIIKFQYNVSINCIH